MFVSPWVRRNKKIKKKTSKLYILWHSIFFSTVKGYCWPQGYEDTESVHEMSPWCLQVSRGSHARCSEWETGWTVSRRYSGGGLHGFGFQRSQSLLACESYSEVSVLFLLILRQCKLSGFYSWPEKDDRHPLGIMFIVWKFFWCYFECW